MCLRRMLTLLLLLVFLALVACNDDSSFFSYEGTLRKPHDYSKLTMKELLELRKDKLTDKDGIYMPIYRTWKGRTCTPSSFTRIELIGEGRHGKIFRAWNYNGDEVALKIFKATDMHSPEYASMIRNEEVMLANLDFPGIPKLYCSFLRRTDLGISVVFAIEYVPGKNLLEWLSRLPHGPSPSSTKSVISQLANIVSYLNTYDIIHRDVKMENVLVTDGGAVYLVDFGHALHAPKGATGLYGTLLNMPPEMLSGKVYDDGVDWWGVGLILYELVTGRHPFINYQGGLKKLLPQVKKGLPATGIYVVDEVIGHICDVDPRKRWTVGNGDFGRFCKLEFFATALFSSEDY